MSPTMHKISYLEDCENRHEEQERHQEAQDELVYVSNRQQKQFDRETKYHTVENCANNGQGSVYPLSRYKAEMKKGFTPCGACVSD